MRLKLAKDLVPGDVLLGVQGQRQARVLDVGRSWTGSTVLVRVERLDIDQKDELSLFAFSMMHVIEPSPCP